MVYLDTGCLVKLYYPEPDSDLVAARSSGQAIVYTPLHALELTTALELKVFRKEATIGQAHAALGLLEEDLSAGKLVAVNTALLDSLDAAVQLARQHAARTGCRALDTAALRNGDEPRCHRVSFHRCAPTCLGSHRRTPRHRGLIPSPKSFWLSSHTR